MFTRSIKCWVSSSAIGVLVFVLRHSNCRLNGRKWMAVTDITIPSCDCSYSMVTNCALPFDQYRSYTRNVLCHLISVGAILVLYSAVWSVQELYSYYTLSFDQYRSYTCIVFCRLISTGVILVLYSTVWSVQELYLYCILPFDQYRNYTRILFCRLISTGVILVFVKHLKENKNKISFCFD
jgi:hypothetical protein